MAGVVIVRGVRLGAGRPKICVPLVADAPGAIVAEAKTALAAGAEVVEWRADFMAAALNAPVKETGEALCAVARELRAALGETPLLFTLRSKGEGGQCTFAEPDTGELLCRAAQTGAVDLVDVELSLGEKICAEVIKTAGENNVATVASHHRFDFTPPTTDMLHTLNVCEAWGADIAKLAVMPRNPADVLSLLMVTNSFRLTGGIPAITMSMGAIGAVSRVAGEVFGSCLTFGAGKNASAPGQIEAGRLAEILEALRLGTEE